MILGSLLCVFFFLVYIINIQFKKKSTIYAEYSSLGYERKGAHKEKSEAASVERLFPY